MIKYIWSCCTSIVTYTYFSYTNLKFKKRLNKNYLHYKFMIIFKYIYLYYYNIENFIYLLFKAFM